MKPSTRLSSAVFQLTPTRTRCDLIIVANGKQEKIASGLLNPFLAHLRTAQEQVTKGGYSILLEPEGNIDAAWFTKVTLERFVRFVSTPEILERVYTIETEILQIEEAIAMQRRTDVGQIIVESHQVKLLGGSEDNVSVSNSNEEKAVVLYKPREPPPETNGSCPEEGNSKVQLLKILEARKTGLQREQGMAFARAVAAGFDIDQMEPLLAFAECFGALRLLEASSRFMKLWKSKHETGQWLDFEASDTLPSRSDFSAMNSSGIVLSVTPNKHDELNPDVSLENNGKSGTSNFVGDNPVPNVQQDYFHGQFPHLVFPPWPMHSLPGSQASFQAYPVQGVPFYQNYNGNGPFFPSPYHMAHSPPNLGHPAELKRSPGVQDSSVRPETWEIDRTRSPDDMEEQTLCHKPQKKSRGSDKKQSGVVVIRNINYITSQEMKSGRETDSDMDSDSGCENSEGDDPVVILQNSKRSSKSKGVDAKSANNLKINGNKLSDVGKDIDDGHWQAFQKCLLRAGDEDIAANTKGMFAMEKNINKKRSVKTVGDDPLSVGRQDTGQMHDTGMADIPGLSGATVRRPRGSGDDPLCSRANTDFRENDDEDDIQFSETNGRRILPRNSKGDFMIGSWQKQDNLRNLSDPLAVNSFESTTNKTNTISSHGIVDETLIVPFRSMSIDQVGQGGRIAIDIESDIPAAHSKLNSSGKRNHINYEPDSLNLLPERGLETSGYDPALNYEMQFCADGSQKKGVKDATEVKGGLRKSDKMGRSKVTSDVLHKQRTGGPIRNSRSSKINTLEDARARAERLRSYKADLQKIKKEKEQAEAKRLEALKLERQRRIAARGTSASAKPSILSSQTKQMPAKLSPAIRGSKFSDSEPGSSSPLQRSKIRTSLGSGELTKTSKATKLSASSLASGNRLTRSSSSLSETRNIGVILDSKASMARTRRLSEPKKLTNPSVTSTKTRNAEASLKRKLFEEFDRGKMSVIVKSDRSKAATLPELKIKISNSRGNVPEKPSALKDGQKANGSNPPTVCERNVFNGNTGHEIHPANSPIVEKTIVMLENEKASLPTLHSSATKSDVQKWQHLSPAKQEKNKVIPDVTFQHSPSLPMDGIDRKPVTSQPQEQLDSNGRNFARASYPVDNSKFSSSTAEKPYRAPHARLSSLEDPGADQLENDKMPVIRAEKGLRAEETVTAYVTDAKTHKVDNNALSSEKANVKESSKGLKRLLKFGKKNHTSSVDRSVDSEGTSFDGAELDSSTRNTASSEGHTSKNLISSDETSSAGNGSQKTSRHFSLFSPFRSKTSCEKKQAS